MAHLVPSKWFSNKSLTLSLPRRRHKPSDVPTPPVFPPKVKDNGRGHEFHEAFRYFDGDGDGKISSEELMAFFASMGDHISSDEAVGIISDHDTDGDNMMDLQDFMRLMETVLGNPEAERVKPNGTHPLVIAHEWAPLAYDHRTDHGDDDPRRAFEMFEVDKGSGCITPNGLHRMFNRLGNHRSHEECEAMIRVFDLDGNGVVDFHEFHRMMS